MTGQSEIPPANNELKLLLCGDVMTGRGIDQLMPHSVGPWLHEPYVKDARYYLELAERRNGTIARPVSEGYIWGDALRAVAEEAPAFTLVNLETAITQSEDYWPDKVVHYRMHPANAACLNRLGVHCCALANNHVLDWGYRGLTETTEVLTQTSLPYCGAGSNLSEAQRPVVLSELSQVHPVGRVVVLSFGFPSSGVPFDWAARKDRAGVNLVPDYSEASLQHTVDVIRAQTKADDIVVVSLHWGANWGYHIDDERRCFARGLIDRAGVDVIHGHSSHHPIGMELYKEHLILYGCGDFINDYEGIRGHEAYRPQLSLLYVVVLNKESGSLRQLRIRPLRIEQLCLRAASKQESEWLLQRLNRESETYGPQFTSVFVPDTTLKPEARTELQFFNR